MAAKSNWILTLYGSNTDLTANSTEDKYPGKFGLISSLTDPLSKSVYILAPQWDLIFDTTVLQDVGGDRIGFTTARPKFDIETYPFSYNANTGTLEQDIDDLVELMKVIRTKSFLFIRVTGGSRTYPNSAGYVYPVTLASWSTAINKDFGNRIVTLSFEHRSRS